jgi:hypothetical protein
MTERFPYRGESCDDSVAALEEAGILSHRYPNILRIKLVRRFNSELPAMSCGKLGESGEPRSDTRVAIAVGPNQCAILFR